ncbi:hypothetical protein AK812_SmicGene15369 [Symbiodinium microadriaticum]|uniref:Uncharacterized protein n=1 Tax=Symbiodinium microadriaticum TaxID=2951 RepID=A0A1Q9E350_SYMMI|nr:hypothetical protein AK812_SmicGene15369 [Symbiodinium microadriaticum]CAE7362808.1 unnamed protein product [Symbiodinium sp. KB8]
MELYRLVDNLMRVKAPKAFILAILCLVFNERLIYRLDKDRQEFYFCEHYAGEGVMTREARQQKLHGRVQPVNRKIGKDGREKFTGTYTKSFGKHMAELLPLFNRSPALRPVSMVDASTIQKLEKLDMGADDWADAGLPGLLQYLYGAKGLVIPTEWQHHIFILVEEGDVNRLKEVAQELQAAIQIAQSDSKTEPGTESQLQAVHGMRELLNKFQLLQAAYVDQKMEIEKLRNSRGQAKRTLSASPPPSKRRDDDSDDDEGPRVLQMKDLTKTEKEKIRRICSPKKGSGNLEVPENVFQMWQDVSKGGFYSKEDLKNELSYSQTRVDKIVAWAEKKGLVRLLGMATSCEYDDETLEYWVNTRTSGTLTKEDLEEMQHKREYSGENEGDLEMNPRVNLDGFDFSDDDPLIHTNPKSQEGDGQKTVASQMKEHLKYVLKAKNSLEGFIDKIRAAGAGDDEGKAKVSSAMKKMNDMLKELDTLYDDMSEAKAEGSTSGYSELTVEVKTYFMKAQKLMSKCSALEASNKLWSQCLVFWVSSELCMGNRNILPSFLDRQLLSKARKAARNAIDTSYIMLQVGCTATPVISAQVYLIATKYGKGTFTHGDKVPAKDLVTDARASAKRDPCEILRKISKIDVSSADAPLYALLRKHGLALPLDFCWTRAGNIDKYPFFSPKAQLEVLSRQGHFHRVLGVPVHLAHEALGLFWKKFRAVHPEHSIFDNSRNLDFEKLIPYYLHGDGGRGFKKDPIEILSMLPALGSGSNKMRYDLSSKRPLQSELELGINLQGNSGANRFLFSVVSSLVAKSDPQIFDDLMETWSESLQALLNHGFQAEGSTWRVVILGFTGDSPFVKKVAKTTRSFHNVRKRFFSLTPQKGCCWLCHAGFESPEEGIFIPFEHLGFTEPEWVKTTRLANPLPWDGNGAAILQHMLLDKADTPASCFRADFFHIWHAGVGQDFTASSLIYAMKVLFGRGGVHRDLSALNEALKNWIRSSGKRLRCGHLTEDLLGYNGTREYPEGKWSKNMDTAIIMKFLTHFLQRTDFEDKVQSDGILQEILASAVAIGRVVKVCFEAEFFMSSAHCMIIIENGHRFLRGYANLVSTCHSRGLCLFKLRPKIHYLNHVFLRVYEEWEASATATNPMAEATFMSEDFVGRTARISRRVSPRAVALKTLQRYNLHMKTALDKETYDMLDFSWLD